MEKEVKPIDDSNAAHSPTWVLRVLVSSVGSVWPTQNRLSCQPKFHSHTPSLALPPTFINLLVQRESEVNRRKKDKIHTINLYKSEVLKNKSIGEI